MTRVLVMLRRECAVVPVGAQEALASKRLPSMGTKGGSGQALEPRHQPRRLWGQLRLGDAQAARTFRREEADIDETGVAVAKMSAPRKQEGPEREDTRLRVKHDSCKGRAGRQCESGATICWKKGKCGGTGIADAVRRLEDASNLCVGVSTCQHHPLSR